MPRALLLSLFVLSAVAAKAQGVGVNNASPDPSALLDLTSTDKGVLVPRMFTFQRTSIPFPATGLLVYDLDVPGFHYFDGTQWRPLTGGDMGWRLDGNTGTTPGTHFLGTTDNQPLSIRTFGTERLRITDQGALIATGDPFPFFGVPPTTEYHRMMWLPSLHAFRAGRALSAWDNGVVGEGSAAFGDENEASGTGSFATGTGNHAFGDHAVAMGLNNIAGQATIAMGSGNVAGGQAATALGNNNSALAAHAVALGNANTIASGSSTSVAIGGNNQIGSNPDNVALGHRIELQGNNVALGRDIQLGSGAQGSMAIGSGVSPGFGLLTTTQNNTLVLGMGSDRSTLALVPGAGMMFGQPGRAGIATDTPQARLEVRKEGNTDATSALLVGDGGAQPALVVRDDDRVGVNTALLPATLTVQGSGSFSASEQVLHVSTVMGNPPALVVTEEGRTGMGVDLPQRDLHVHGADGLQVTTNNTGSAAANGLLLRFDGVNDAELINQQNGMLSLRSGGFNSQLLLNGTTGDVAVPINNMGIGTDQPTQRLHVAGSIRMVDGNEAAGRVLVSSADGTATWQDPASNGGTLDQAYDFGGAGAGRTITADAGAVSVAGTDGLQVTGTLNSGATIALAGAGVRMFFNPRKAAFRAGNVNGTQWNDVNVGEASAAWGTNTTASGGNATAWGNNIIASGGNATAWGTNNLASGGNATAWGNGISASGTLATAWGEQSFARSFAETALGLFNTLYTPTATATWSATDRLFVIGNGTTNATRSNALTMFKNGNVVFGSSTLDDMVGTDDDNRMFFNKVKAAFRAGTAQGTQWDDGNVGVRSAAWGINTTASGVLSTAWGINTTATGTLATAGGSNTSAPSHVETALGYFNTIYTPTSTVTSVATDRLFVIGNGTNAVRSDALVILKNGNTGIGISVPTQRLHVAGSIRMVDGNEAAGRVLTSSADGTATWQPPTGGGGTLDASYDFGAAGAGRTITADAGAVSVAGTDGLQVTGTLNSGATIALAGAGVRMFFNPRKAAFRAGQVNNMQWNDVNVGEASAAWGSSTTASGENATAWGNIVLASGGNATAWGNLVSASGGNATAWGHGTSASGTLATAWGEETFARSFAETALGLFNTNYIPTETATWSATDRLFVIGNGTTGLNRSNALTMFKNGNVVFGSSTLDDIGGTGDDNRMFFNKVKAAFRVGTVNGTQWNDANVGVRSVAWGINTTATGTGSTAWGGSTTAPSFNETTLGTFSTIYTPLSATTFNANDRLFTIGNGTSDAARRNALVILKNGNTGIGISAPTERLHVAGRSLFHDGFSANNAALLYRSNTDYMFIGPQSGSSANGGAIALYGSTNNAGGNTNGIDLNVPGGSVRFQHTNGNFIFRTNSTSGYTATVELNDVGLQFGHNSTGRDINFVNGNGERLRITPTGSNLTAGGSWGVLSDRRVKSDVRTIDYGLKEVLAMRPVRYFHHETKGFAHTPGERNKEGRADIGFIAQDLYTVVPEVVVRPADEQTTLWAVTYERLVPVLVKAVQEQQAQIETLRTELEAMREATRQARNIGGQGEEVMKR